MTDEQTVDDSIRHVIRKEIEALERILNAPFDLEPLVNRIVDSPGRVVVTGVGKSGLIGRKISATFCSTATPSSFIHPVEALHGDIGTLGEKDLVIAISASGETEELLAVLPFLRRRGVPTAAMTCNLNSSLATRSDYVVPIDVDFEADPFLLIPSCTTTAMLAMGDAIAIAALRKRKFTREQFAELHPSGSLGRKLLLQVSDIMHVGNEIPLINSDASVGQTVCRIGEKRLGAAFVSNGEGKLLGVLTDGDVRRLLESGENPLDFSIEQVMTKSPITIRDDRLAVDAVGLMQAKEITILPVLDSNEMLVGAIHLHDLLKAGLG